MGDHPRGDSSGSSAQLQAQPPALEAMLRSMDTARKALALYGPEHPAKAEFVDELAGHIEELLDSFHNPTCVFTKTAVIVSEHAFVPSNESQGILRLLRERGVMAITFVGQPESDEIQEFLAFLSTDPDDIRREGEGSKYLRRRGVRRIAATDAVYAAGGAAKDDNSLDHRAVEHAQDVDLAISYAIDRLSKRDEEESESPRMPITEILSDPEMAAGLIREAVNKLHASREDYTNRELATEVVNDLKDLAGAESQEWDSAAPQIRRAVSKLPKEMLPAALGFSLEDGQDGKDAEAETHRTAQVSDVEQMIAKAIDSEGKGGNEHRFLDPACFDELFGARANGLLSNWRRALRPSSVIRSSGKTMETLMIWEQRPPEHGRISRTLASLIPRAVETEDIDSALVFVESLIKEIDCGSEVEWRASNAISALQEVDKQVLVSLIHAVARSRDYRVAQIAAALVESVPGLALCLLDLLGTDVPEPLVESLKLGIVNSGQSALEPLGEILRDGSLAARECALDAVGRMSGHGAAQQIARALEGADPAFAIKALELVPSVRVPLALDICVKALSDPSLEVRCAAIRTMGKLGDGRAVRELVRIAVRHGAKVEEKTAAVEALGFTERAEALQYLDDMTHHRPLFGRRAYETVRVAAQRAAKQIRRADSAA